ncbi:hypothetical protein NBRC116493_03740 [Aurantivibrio infirmus]
MSTESIYNEPQSRLDNLNEFTWSGETIRIQSPGKLPKVCVGCGTTEGLNNINGTLSYVSPVIFLWLLLSPIALIIAHFLTRKKASIEYSQCGACTRKSKLWGNVSIVFWLVFVIAILVRIFVGKQLLGVQVAIILGAPILALFATAMKDTQLSVKQFTEPHFYIKGFNKKFKEKLTKPAT